MSKTIQLISTTDNQRLNVILSGSTLSIDGKRYCLSDHDLTRLLMFCEDNAERINSRVRQSIYFETEHREIIACVNSCEARIDNGAEIEAAFEWLRQEINEVFDPYNPMPTYTGCDDHTGKEFNHIEKVER